MRPGNFLYAQSGGVTAVINATAGAIIEAARAQGHRVLAAHDGILGVLREELFDTTAESAAAIAALRHTPGGAFGSCRFKLGSIEVDRARFARIIEVCRTHDIRWFLYNGGNDSADTALKLSRVGAELGYPLRAIGVPKTVDNDLVLTDCCPGYGSAAKYTAISVREASLDVAAMASSSTRVFIMEVMGRNAGWIAAAAGLAGDGPDSAPQVILFPERSFDAAAFLARVDKVVKRVGWCVVVASEGIRDAAGELFAAAGGSDAFGHAQLGGVAPRLARLVRERLELKVHWTLPDYLQRSARHVASQTDLDQAIAVGKAAVEYALEGRNGVMPVIARTSDRPYRWRIEAAPLARIANRERPLPAGYIRRDGYGITDKARTCLLPLIAGEAYPPYGEDGLPKYTRLRRVPVTRRLPAFAI